MDEKAQIREQISLDETIAYFNELIELDRPALAALVANRVPCNKALADHPTVQAGAQHGGFYVGLIGIINGLFGIHENGWGSIAWVFEDGDPGEERRLVKLCRTADLSGK